MRCSNALKPFDHGDSSRGILKLLSLLLLPLVPFPDTCSSPRSENERTKLNAGTWPYKLQAHVISYIDLGGRRSSILTIIMVVLLIGKSQLEGVGNDTALVSPSAFKQIPVTSEDQRLR